MATDPFAHLVNGGEPEPPPSPEIETDDLEAWESSGFAAEQAARKARQAAKAAEENRVRLAKEKADLLAGLKQPEKKAKGVKAMRPCPKCGDGCGVRLKVCKCGFRFPVASRKDLQFESIKLICGFVEQGGNKGDVTAKIEAFEFCPVGQFIFDCGSKEKAIEQLNTLPPSIDYAAFLKYLAAVAAAARQS